jgi:hypothetical protein
MTECCARRFGRACHTSWIYFLVKKNIPQWLRANSAVVIMYLSTHVKRVLIRNTQLQLSVESYLKVNTEVYHLWCRHITLQSDGWTAVRTNMKR